MSNEPVNTAIGNLILSPATLADQAHVQSLLLGASQWLHERGIPQWLAGEFTPADIAKLIKRGGVYLARLDEQPVATLTLYHRLQREDTHIWGNVPDDATYIHKLAVGRAFAGKDIGRAMLRWAEGEAVKMGKAFLRLDCWADNAPLCRYYESIGFTFKGRWDFKEWNCARYERAITLSNER